MYMNFYYAWKDVYITSDISHGEISSRNIFYFYWKRFHYLYGVLWYCLNINNSKLVENPDSSSEKVLKQMIIPLYKDESVYMSDKKMKRT